MLYFSTDFVDFLLFFYWYLNHFSSIKYHFSSIYLMTKNTFFNKIFNSLFSILLHRFFIRQFFINAINTQSKTHLKLRRFSVRDFSNYCWYFTLSFWRNMLHVDMYFWGIQINKPLTYYCNSFWFWSKHVFVCNRFCFSYNCFKRKYR